MKKKTSIIYSVLCMLLVLSVGYSISNNVKANDLKERIKYNEKVSFDLYYRELEGVHKAINLSIEGKQDQALLNMFVRKMYVAQEGYIGSLYMNEEELKLKKLDELRMKIDAVINIDLTRLTGEELASTNKQLEELLDELKEMGE